MYKKKEKYQSSIQAPSIKRTSQTKENNQFKDTSFQQDYRHYQISLHYQLTMFVVGAVGGLTWTTSLFIDSSPIILFWIPLALRIFCTIYIAIEFYKIQSKNKVFPNSSSKLWFKALKILKTFSVVIFMFVFKLQAIDLRENESGLFAFFIYLLIGSFSHFLQVISIGLKENKIRLGMVVCFLSIFFGLQELLFLTIVLEKFILLQIFFLFVSVVLFHMETVLYFKESMSIQNQYFKKYCQVYTNVLLVLLTFFVLIIVMSLFTYIYLGIIISGLHCLYCLKSILFIRKYKHEIIRIRTRPSKYLKFIYQNKVVFSKNFQYSQIKENYEYFDKIQFCMKCCKNSCSIALLCHHTSLCFKCFQKQRKKKFYACPICRDMFWYEFYKIDQQCLVEKFIYQKGNFLISGYLGKNDFIYETQNLRSTAF